MYQALYRKWRPRTFDDVVGQEQVTETLKNQIASERVSHAYLFVGVRGTGKTTCAKILSRALNCEAPENGNPCNRCKSCTGIESGSVMDVVEIDAASNNGVENVRALREEAVYSPASVKKRVYIIDEVHMLSTSAFNALLKILEEPPEHLVFILATTEIHKVPPTILSRCQRYSFGRISPEAIAERLEYVANQESIALDGDAATLLARLADGSLRDGLSLLDQCSGAERVTSERVLSAMGLAGNFRIARLLENITDRDSAAAITLFESLWREGKAPATVLSELAALLRDLMLLSVAPKGGGTLLSGGFDDKTLASLNGRITVKAAMEYLALIQDSIGRLRDGRDPKIEAQLCLIALCEPELLDTPERLGLRIALLEKAVVDGAFTVSEKSAERTAPPNAQLSDREADDDEPPFDIEGEPDVSGADSYISDKNEPEEVSVPVRSEPEASRGEPESGDLWATLYAALKSTMQPFHLALFSGASVHMQGEKLVILVKGSFEKSALGKPEPQELIREAVKKAMGRSMPFTIDEKKPSQGELDKLSELSKFGNVKFE